MINLERDLRIVESMSSEIKRYVLGNSLYWSLSDIGRRGSYMLPKGTIGDMLLRIHHLSVLEGQLSVDQAYRLRKARENSDYLLNKWIVQSEEKILRETRARLNSWLAYLEEVDDNPKAYYDEYRMQSRGRTIISFLLEQAGGAVSGSGIYRLLGHADRRLRGLIVEHPFIWDARLQIAYPQQIYWWLYAMPDLEREPDIYKRHSR